MPKTVAALTMDTTGVSTIEVISGAALLGGLVLFILGAIGTPVRQVYESVMSAIF